MLKKVFNLPETKTEKVQISLLLLNDTIKQLITKLHVSNTMEQNKVKKPFKTSFFLRRILPHKPSRLPKR
jgi:hypothetical protein